MNSIYAGLIGVAFGLAAIVLFPWLFDPSRPSFSDIIVGAQPAFTTAQGGTGTTSPSGILYGDGTLRLKTLLIGSNLSFDGTTLTASGGAADGDFSTTSAIYFVNASTTIPKTYTANIWSLLQSFTSATSTNFGITNSLSFGGVTGSTWASFCTAITGGADLCDGSDAAGAGGTGSNWNVIGGNQYMTPSTTIGVIINASSTIGNGSAGLTVNGSATTTGALVVGGHNATLAAAIASPSAFLTSSTTGRSGMLLANNGSGTAPEYRFAIFDPFASSQYLSFGMTNSNASAGGTLFGLNKTAIGYLFTQTRDLLVGTVTTGENLYLAAGNSVHDPDITLSGQIDTDGYFGIGTTSPYAKLSVAGDTVAARYVATTSLASIFPFASTTALSATTLCLSSDCRTSWPTGGGGGSGTVGTSSIPTVGQLAYWTSNGFPSLLGSVATTSLTTTGALSLSQPISVLGGSASVLSLDTSGTWSGNAGTATALAANGGNCSAGSFPLGVDTSGAVETCTDAWTEAENTSAAYLNLTSLGAIPKGYFFSTTSADFWETQQTARTADDLTNNSIENLSDVLDGITENLGDLLYWNGSSWADIATSSLNISWANLVGIPAGFADNTDDTGTDTLDDLSDNSIEDLNDVAAMTENYGDVFVWNGSTWTDFATSSLDIGPTGLLASDFGDFTCNGTTCTLDQTYLTANQTITLSGDVTGSGSTAITTTIANGAVDTYDLATTSPIADGEIIVWDADGTFYGFTCAEITGAAALCDGDDASGSGGGNISGWATSTPFSGQLLLYPTNGTEDVVFASNGSASTSTAPFWWDVSATTTYIGNGGAGDSRMLFGSSTVWSTGLASSTLGYYIARGTTLTSNPALWINTNNQTFLTSATSTLFTATTAWLTNLFIGVDTIAEYIADTAGAMVTGNTETDITVSYDDADNTFDFVVDTLPNLTGTLDIDSGGTNLTSVGASSTVLTTNGSIMIWQSIASYITETVRTASLIITGAWDFGGATSLEIPNGASVTVDAIGEITLDTTANQLIIATSTVSSNGGNGVIPIEQPLFSVTIASTTPEFITSGTIPVSRWLGKERYITRFECFVTGGTSKVVNVTDGTNDTETITCGTTATADSAVTTNANFTANELWYLEFGATSGTVNYVTFTAYGHIMRQ